MSADSGIRHESVQYKRKALPLRLVRHVLRREQEKIYRQFARTFPPRPEWKVLDLGVNGSLDRPEQHFFEWNYPFRDRIVAAGLEPPEVFRGCFPEIEYVQLGREDALPFADREFDVVFCSAVVEHVGSRQRQRAFLSEIARVSKAAFITTPNRWFPVELHTMLPLVHYLPTKWYRAIFHAFGFHFFAEEENLNLLDRRALTSILPRLRSMRIVPRYFLGFVSNLSICWNRGDSDTAPAGIKEPS